MGLFNAVLFLVLSIFDFSLIVGLNGLSMCFFGFP